MHGKLSNNSNILTKTLTMSLCDQIWTGSISSGVWDLIPNVFRVAWSWLDSEITATWTIALMLPFVWKISEKIFIDHCRNHKRNHINSKYCQNPKIFSLAVSSQNPKLQRLHYSYISIKICVKIGGRKILDLVPTFKLTTYTKGTCFMMNFHYRQSIKCQLQCIIPTFA